MKLWADASEQKSMQLVNRKSEIENVDWLPDMDLNHDKQIQSLLCYRYTIGQAGAWRSVNLCPGQSSRQTAVSEGRKTIAHGFNRGSVSPKSHKSRRDDRKYTLAFGRPIGTRLVSTFYAGLKRWESSVDPIGY